MPDYKTLLDSIQDQTSRPPEIVTSLSLPGITEWSPGQVRSLITPAAYLAGPVGLFGGYLAMITDTMATHVSMTLLDDDEWIVTTELDMRFNKALRTESIAAIATASRDEDSIVCRVEYRSADAAVGQVPGAVGVVVERVRSTRIDSRGDHDWNNTSS